MSLDAAGLEQPVKGGDLIRVLSIVPRFSNAVTLRGNVANPGHYSWRAGMRICDLIPDPNILLTRKYWQTSNAIVRDTTDYVRSAKDATNVNAGEIRNEVKISAPAINWEYAVVQRLDPVDLSSRLIPFSLRGAIIEKHETDNVELQAGDIVTIFSQRDVAVPQSQQTKLVRVEGEVRAPGIYRAEENETLAALIQRAGGLTKDAYLYGTQFTRESARIEQQDSLDQLTKLLESQIQQKAVNDSNANPSDSQAITARVAEQKMLVAQLKATQATGRVVLPIHPRDGSLASLPAVILEDKDTIIIPPRNATVSVIGAVYTQSSFLYRMGSKVSDYVRAAGNGTQSADMHHVMLIRANGSMIGKKQGFSVFDSDFQSLGVLPGDMIIIPTKLQSGAFGKALRDWTQITAQLAISAASLAVISR